MLGVSIRDLDPMSLSRLRTVLAQDLVALARGSSGPNMDIVYRDVRPTDLNNGTLIGKLDNPSLTADTYANDVYSTWTKLTQNQALGVQALADEGPVPSIDEITFVAAPTTIGIVPTDQAWCNSIDARIYFIDPPVWQPNEHPNISLLGHVTTSAHADSFQWVGIIAENQSTVGLPRVLLPSKVAGQPGRVPGHI